MTVETTGGNKLIADFMGEKPYGFEKKNFLILGQHLSPEQLPYETSWAWLMPVVSKLEDAGASVIIGKMFCEIKYSNPLNLQQNFETKIVCGVKIKAVYGAVIQSIKWFNSENLKF